MAGKVRQGLSPVPAGLRADMTLFLGGVRDALTELQWLGRFLAALSGKQQGNLLTQLRRLSSQESSLDGVAADIGQMMDALTGLQNANADLQQAYDGLLQQHQALQQSHTALEQRVANIETSQ